MRGGDPAGIENRKRLQYRNSCPSYPGYGVDIQVLNPYDQNQLATQSRTDLNVREISQLSQLSIQKPS